MAAADGTGPEGEGGPASAGVAPSPQAASQDEDDMCDDGVGGPASAGDAAPEPGVTEGADAMSDMGSDSDPMLEALLATMTEALAEDAQSIHNLCIVNGCSVKDAQRNVVELCSPPRVTHEIAAAPRGIQASARGLHSTW